MQDSPVAGRLCAACGMCCDGTLFHSVEIRGDDQPRRLASLGLKLRRKKGVQFFLQPCAAHTATESGCACTLYADRPERCRLFQCGQLRGVMEGTIPQAEAFATIGEARRRISGILDLLGRIGGTNPNRALAQRVAHALTSEEQTPLQLELADAMRGLERLLEEHFQVP